MRASRVFVRKTSDSMYPGTRKRGCAGRIHVVPVGGEAPGGDEEMRVVMVPSRAGPGVEHGEDAGRPPDPGVIAGEGLDHGGGFAEGGIDDLRMGLGDDPEGRRQGEGEEVVITGEEPGARAREPVLGAVLLTGGTMAVATRVVAVFQRATGVTAIEEAAEGWGVEEHPNSRSAEQANSPTGSLCSPLGRVTSSTVHVRPSVCS